MFDAMRLIFIWFAIQLVLAVSAGAAGRVPKPEFDTSYQIPVAQAPAPRGVQWQYIDTALLTAALLLAARLALKTRSRRGLLGLSLFSLAYFGFWRHGCVCPIGAIQNVSLSLTDAAYHVPWTVLFFFLLPLIFALFYGRVFCGAVCPLGAVQDTVIVNPVQLPAWLNHVLGIGPYLYLGVAVLCAACGAGFVICQLDPFVAFFRFAGEPAMFLIGIGMLLLGTIVARPYCRFCCPYGVLLSWFSRLSKWHTTITPDRCITCRLCEESCPFDAIRNPTRGDAPEARRTSLRRAALLLALLPVLALLGASMVSHLRVPLSRLHPTVRLAEEIQQQERGSLATASLASVTFRGTGRPVADLIQEAVAIRRRFATGGWWLGAFLGLCLGGKLLALSLRRPHADYEPDRGTCLSCGRCFSSCPHEHARRERV